MTLRLTPSIFPHENTAQKYVYLINQNKRRKKRKKDLKTELSKLVKSVVLKSIL